MSGSREESKALRREAILDAAMDLLDQFPAADVTTEQIATKANVSHATVFNLVGTRPELMKALAARQNAADSQQFVDDMHRLKSDPIEGIREILDRSVRAPTARPTAYRQLIAQVVGQPAPIEEGLQWPCMAECIREAQQRAIIRSSYDPRGLTLQIFGAYVMAILAWVEGRLDMDECLLVARHGLYTVLAATAVDQHQAEFRDELATLSKELGSVFPWG